MNVDRTAHTFTFQTFHASLYSWVVGAIASLGATFTTAYTPASDGFQIVNFGSSYNREGECFGMTSFSLWFYENHKASAGPFYPKYYDILATDSLGRPLRGQNIIATRSFISITQQWTSYYPLVSSQINLTPAERLASIENALLNTNNPVLIYLFGNGTSAHSVLAYGFESLSNLAATVSVYDPNVPGDATRKIVYNGASGFSPYSGFPGIIYSGDGSLNLTEPYQHILDDADQNFHNSADATLNVTSHSNGQTVPERNITLAGTINSSQVLVTKLTVLVGSTSYSANVGLDGAFSIPIELNTGVNHLQFATQGNDASGNLIPVPNTLATTDFTLIADVANSIVLMTLTWDTNDSDIDTYVIDPSGDYSAYYHKNTADGGMLDRDVTTGFGPEHWTLRTTDTIRYGQPYQFRIHYFSDHGHGPSNYTVTIKLYEGTPREATFTYRGNLSLSNPQNNLPNGQGADWVDIASFTLTQQPAPQNLQRAPNAAASAETNGESTPDIVITAPIPPASQRMKR